MKKFKLKKKSSVDLILSQICFGKLIKPVPTSLDLDLDLEPIVRKKPFLVLLIQKLELALNLEKCLRFKILRQIPFKCELLYHRERI